MTNAQVSASFNPSAGASAHKRSWKTPASTQNEMPPMNP